MRRHSLVWQILLPFMAILLGGVTVTAIILVDVTRQFQLQETERLLETHARLVLHELTGTLSGAEIGRIQSVCTDFGRLTGSRITVIASSGKVLADSDEDSNTMDNHADRQEVVDALAGNVGKAKRYSYTLNSDALYVAVPVIEGERGTGVIRASRSLASMSASLRSVVVRHVSTAFVVMALMGVAVVAVARRTTRPLRRMANAVRRFDQGALEARLEVPESTELAELAEAMNLLAGQLQERIDGMQQQRTELDAVLLSMSEGIVAVDLQEQIVRLNMAAARLFHTTPGAARGRSVEEVMRNSKLHECVRRIFAGSEAFEEELVFGGAPERLLRVSATRLQAEEGPPLGALLVLDDITQLRALERMRSEFVANVSHEIRTPVTSIKGYAETLVNDRPGAQETVDRFLQVIMRQSDRLCALVDDILALSNLERREVTGEALMEDVDVRLLVEAAVHSLGVRAADKEILLSVSCPEGLHVKGDAVLLEQAVTNLIDNAIKYSSPGGQVEVRAELEPEGVALHVMDEGIGIGAEHLPRLFERFYRVDRARSRSVGGTGLGLAIVKHIASLHHGRVGVESVPGKGSRFTLHLGFRPDLF